MRGGPGAGLGLIGFSSFGFGFGVRLHLGLCGGNRFAWAWSGQPGRFVDLSYGSSTGLFGPIFINRLDLLLILPSPPRALDIPPPLLSLSPVIPRPLTPPAGLSRSVPRRRTYRQECGWVDRGGRQGACGGDY